VSSIVQTRFFREWLPAAGTAILVLLYVQVFKALLLARRFNY
jgi:hypothetical protein